MPVVRQRAAAAEADRLRQRGERLVAAEHPGVVRVLRSRPHAEGWELVTEHGGPSLAVAGLRSPRRLAGLAGSVATTLADLHERGIVHGRLDATHVLVGPHGHPRLCGFGPPDAAPVDDVAALGALLAEQLDARPAAGAADRRAGGLLRAVAASAQAEPATRRPSARRLAVALNAEAPASPRGSRPPRPRPRSHLLVAGVVLAAGLALAVALLRGPDTDPNASLVPVSTTPSSTVGRTSATVPSCVARAGHPLSSAACGRAVAVDGGAVVVDGRRYVVGRPGDEVAVADWDCAGAPRAAVLHPDTGEVLVLAPFPVAGAPAVERAERIPGARSLQVREPPDGCPTLGVLEGSLPAGSTS